MNPDNEEAYVRQMLHYAPDTLFFNEVTERLAEMDSIARENLYHELNKAGLLNEAFALKEQKP